MLAKFSAPQPPPFLFARPGLAERLNRCVEFPLTQIAAPAGYGKTTLAADCFRKWGCAKAWIALDEGDDDPSHFLATLAQGLSTAHASLREALKGFSRGPMVPDPDAYLSGILAALDGLPCQLITVLDDCAALAAPQTRRLAARFLAALPANAHFILLTRDPSALPVSRWRLRQSLLELGPGDLALGEGELGDWAQRRMGVVLGGELRSRLHTTFEGWFAGLQLLALRIEREPDRLKALDAVDPHPYLFSYLLEEVLGRMPPDWRRFLLETSILGHLEPELCDEVRQAGNSAHLLQALHQAQCFLAPLAGGGYRYHRLFAESLRGLLAQWEPSEVPQLHRRAARWYLRHGLGGQALEHALAAGDGDTLEALAARALESLFRNSGFAALQRHIRRIPESISRGRPWLSIFSAWALLHTGKEAEGAVRLKDAERILAPEGGPASPGRPGSAAQWAHVRLLGGILARLEGRPARSLALLRRAESEIPPDAGFLRASASSQAAIGHFLQGDLPEAEAGLRRAIGIARDASHLLAWFGAVYSLGEILAIRGRLPEAEILLQDAQAQAGRLPDSGAPASGYLRLARGRWLRSSGRAAEAMAEADAGIALGKAGGNIRMLEYGHALVARLRLESGDLDGALAALDLAEQAGMRNRMHWAAQCDDTRALRIRCLGADRERASADAWMDREGAATRRPHWAGADRFRTACAIEAWRGNAEGAARLADRWARHAHGEGWLGLAEECRLLSEGYLPPAFGGTAAPKESQAQSELSEREIEVLRAMRDGKSNKEIAGSLFVAPSTVKTHLKKIFLKLEVNNRVRAVTRAEETGILR